MIPTEKTSILVGHQLALASKILACLEIAGLSKSIQQGCFIIIINKTFGTECACDALHAVSVQFSDLEHSHCPHCLRYSTQVYVLHPYYITYFGCIVNIYSGANKALLTWREERERKKLCYGCAMWFLVCVFLLAAGLVIHAAALIFPR